MTTTMTTVPHLKAEQLKNEGNDLFVKKDYAAACKKYTEAIALDDKNAVLYCNRAAASTGMGRCVLSARQLHLARR